MQGDYGKVGGVAHHCSHDQDEHRENFQPLNAKPERNDLTLIPPGFGIQRGDAELS